LIVVVAAHVNEAVRKIPPLEQQLAAGVAAGNIMLAAVALGYNAMWKTGTAAYDPAVAAALGFAAADSIVGFLYLGTEAGKAPVARGEWRDLVREWPGAAV
ncbi:MAG TPA: nitroreductase family protein, partial [Steroidobacteraceae bacterium]|nr:nitroreductase family protein [Steroidobacteraceae bacterium]